MFISIPIPDGMLEEVGPSEEPLRNFTAESILYTFCKEIWLFNPRHPIPNPDRKLS